LRYDFKEVHEKDMNRILEIYNSNTEFLQSHIGLSDIDLKWLSDELTESRKLGFSSYKIIDALTLSVVGFIDFQIADEAYLSLLMIDRNYNGKGIGTQLYKTFEDLFCTEVTSIRIDLVKEYNSSVFNFWKRQGFLQKEDVKLKWNDKILEAHLMRKSMKKCEG